MNMREISGVPFIHVSNIGFFGIDLILKNILDYLLGIIFFILFIPIYLFVGLLIKINSKGPILYKQKRLTKNLKEFDMYKFRTMYVDADKRLKEIKKYNEKLLEDFDKALNSDQKIELSEEDMVKIEQLNKLIEKHNTKHEN